MHLEKIKKTNNLGHIFFLVLLCSLDFYLIFKEHWDSKTEASSYLSLTTWTADTYLDHNHKL